MPSEDNFNNTLENYNAGLALNHFVENCTITNFIDNKALLNICERNFRLPKPTLGDFNHIIVDSLLNYTSAFRYPSQLLNSMLKIAVSLIPFPRIHFMSLSLSSLHPRN